MVSIVGLSRATVLAALYNGSRPQGMGFMHYDPKPMDEKEAEEWLSRTKHFDYLNGRVMKISLTNDIEFEEHLYDRDNGNGAAQKVIDALRKSQSVNPPEVAEQHVDGKREAAMEALTAMQQPTEFKDGVCHLGLGDMEKVLGPKVKDAIK